MERHELWKKHESFLNNHISENKFLKEIWIENTKLDEIIIFWKDNENFLTNQNLRFNNNTLELMLDLEKVKNLIEIWKSNTEIFENNIFFMEFLNCKTTQVPKNWINNNLIFELITNIREFWKLSYQFENQNLFELCENFIKNRWNKHVDFKTFIYYYEENKEVMEIFKQYDYFFEDKIPLKTLLQFSPKDISEGRELYQNTPNWLKKEYKFDLISLFSPRKRKQLIELKKILKLWL